MAEVISSVSLYVVSFIPAARYHFSVFCVSARVCLPLFSVGYALFSFLQKGRERERAARINLRAAIFARLRDERSSFPRHRMNPSVCVCLRPCFQSFEKSPSGLSPSRFQTLFLFLSSTIRLSRPFAGAEKDSPTSVTRPIRSTTFDSGGSQCFPSVRQSFRS